MISEFFQIHRVGELPPHEDALTHLWHRRLYWVLIVAVLLTIPAFYLEAIGPQLQARRVGWLLYLLAAIGFTVYMGRLLHLCKHRREFLRRHWLDSAILLGIVAGLFGTFGNWSALEWVLRLALTGLIALRLALLSKGLLSPSGTLYILALGFITLAISGAGFYWLEPTITSYADGMWLAFVTGATVGYGDVVPTTPASRIFAVFMVLLGYAMLSLVTASIAAFFVGEDEKVLRKEMHADMKKLHDDIKALREELQAMRETKHIAPED
jgi:voltage-gated potassium channel